MTTILYKNNKLVVERETTDGAVSHPKFVKSPNVRNIMEVGRVTYEDEPILAVGMDTVFAGMDGVPSIDAIISIGGNVVLSTKLILALYDYKKSISLILVTKNRVITILVKGDESYETKVINRTDTDTLVGIGSGARKLLGVTSLLLKAHLPNGLTKILVDDMHLCDAVDVLTLEG